MCQLLDFPRSLLYRQPAHKKDHGLLEHIERVVTAFQGYGYRRVHRQLVKEGVEASERQVRRILRDEGLLARRARSKGLTRARLQDRRAPNLAKDFQADAPNQIWAADTTQLSTASGPVYLACLVDVYSRRAVGWHLSRRNDMALVLACLNKALESRRPQAGWIHHSDQGSPYTAQDYVQRIRDRGGRLSLTRPGAPQENAYIESFFRTLKLEEADKNRYQGFLEAEAALSRFIEKFYNQERMHSRLGYLSPDEFERRHAGGAA
jgi:transposase InsO family protein